MKDRYKNVVTQMIVGTGCKFAPTGSILKLILIVFTLNSCGMSVKKYELYPSENAHLFYPVSQYSGVLFFEDETSVYIPAGTTCASRVWGRPGGTYIRNSNMFAVPDSVEIAWLSIVENKFYGVRAALPKERIRELLEMKDPETKEQMFENMVFGMAPYGGLAVWFVGGSRNVKYTIEIAWIQGEETNIHFSDFRHNAKTLVTGREFCEWMLQNWHEEADSNLKENGPPDRELFNNYAAKFNYRIVPVFEKTDTKFKVTTVHYYNGEWFTVHYDIGKYNPEELLMRHDLYEPKSKPYRINVMWKEGKNVYDAFFWTDEKKIIETFAKFYDNDAQKKGDFVIKIGKSHNQFEFFLQNDAVSVEIPAEEIQIIVFKNKWEFFRSENYDKPPGGWKFKKKNCTFAAFLIFLEK